MRRLTHEDHEEADAEFPEVCERAARMALEHRGSRSSSRVAYESIAPKIGYVPQTLHEWVRKHGVDTSMCDSVSRDEAEVPMVTTPRKLRLKQSNLGK